MSSPQASYSIKDLETLSGIKSHTIRIWEKRYKLLRPKRSATNIRFYSNDDLKKILNISFLNRNGFKISSIAEMKDKDITEKVIELTEVPSNGKGYTHLLEAAMLQMDEAAFTTILNEMRKAHPMEKSFSNILVPFFERLGVMWQTGTINPAQEHFASNLIRQMVVSATNELPYDPEKDSTKLILVLPEHELHELSLLFINHGLRVRGMNTLYLGQTVPWSSIQRTADIFKPDFLVAVYTCTIDPIFLKKSLAELRKSFPGKILLGGKAFEAYDQKLPSRAFVFSTFNELLQKIKSQS